MYRRGQFSSDGKRIFFTADRELGDVRAYVQDLEGGTPTEIGGEGYLPLALSPDGRYVAASGPDGIYVCSIDRRTPPRRIPGAHGEPFQWSSDGKAVFTELEDGPRLILSRVDLATGREERLRLLAPPDLTGFLRFGSRPVGMGTTITPDGRYYAYTYVADLSRLVLSDVGPDWWR